MNTSSARLLSIAGDSIADPIGSTDALRRWGVRGQELATMLESKNGFYAYETALLVRPLRSEGVPLGLLEWNTPELWKRNYVEDLSGALFFAEDAFGAQFCICQDSICTFDPETGQFQAMSPSLDAWASEVTVNYQFRTGHPLAHSWQIQNELLAPGTRLLPKIPFICGGKYEVENLYPLADVKGMTFRASIANQIRDLPDGAEIVLKTD